MATGNEQFEVTLEGRNERKTSMQMSFEGVIPNLERRFRETGSEYIRAKITEYMTDKPCPTCNGNRLRPEALAVTVLGHNIIEITHWPINQTLDFIRELSKPGVLTRRELTIAERILKEIQSRLGFLVNVGLDYLTLSRSAGSLSGGEAQRVKLSAELARRSTRARPCTFSTSRRPVCMWRTCIACWKCWTAWWTPGIRSSSSNIIWTSSNGRIM